jgi:hypothetical protein
MSMVYAVAGVLILKTTVCPCGTLMLVANPWIVESPAPVMSHSLGRLPGFWFSQTIGLIVGPQPLCACTPPLGIWIETRTAAASTAAMERGRTVDDLMGMSKRGAKLTPAPQGISTPESAQLFATAAPLGCVAQTFVQRGRGKPGVKEGQRKR